MERHPVVGEQRVWRVVVGSSSTTMTFTPRSRNRSPCRRIRRGPLGARRRFGRPVGSGCCRRFPRFSERRRPNHQNVAGALGRWLMSRAGSKVQSRCKGMVTQRSSPSIFAVSWRGWCARGSPMLQLAVHLRQKEGRRPRSSGSRKSSCIACGTSLGAHFQDVTLEVSRTKATSSAISVLRVEDGVSSGQRAQAAVQMKGVGLGSVSVSSIGTPNVPVRELV